MKEKAETFIRQIVLKNINLEFFALLSLLYILSALIVNEYIIVDELYYRSLESRLSLNIIENIINFRNKWQWIAYAGIPLLLASKLILISTFISMGSIIAGYTLSFRQIISLAMIAEVVYLTASFVSTFTILFSEINTLDDLDISILSLASLLTGQTVEPYFYYPLKSLNIFLLLYILVITYCYKIITSSLFQRSLALILSTYGTALILWNILVMYLLISYA